MLERSLTQEDLLKELMELRQKNKELQAQMSFLIAENEHLKRQISTNSRNSSKPPSSDGFKKEPKPNPKSQRKKGKRKSGGQRGHKGHKLRMVAKADEIIRHGVETCTCCGCSLTKESLLAIDKRQVFDIPPLKMQVTEHQSEVKNCPKCGKVNRGNFPEGLVQEAQYGPRIKAFLTYINQYHFIPYCRSKSFIRDLFGHTISEGTINNFIACCHQKLELTEETIKGGLISAKALHHDETGMRVFGKLYWQHVASTKDLTFYGIHKKRGHDAIEAADILPRYKGSLIHDHFQPYFKYAKSHVLCNAHHLRELIFIEEQHKQEWAKHMQSLLLAIKNQVALYKQQGKKRFPWYRLFAYERCYDEIIMNGLWQPNNIPKVVNGKKEKKQSKAKNLLDRLRQYKTETLAYMYNFNIPFDNNLAERDLRMSKVKQKVSGCFRSEQGAEWFCRVRGYISTARKNGIQILSAIENAFLGTPFTPNLQKIG